MKDTHWMRMDGRCPERVLHYKFLTTNQLKGRKDCDLWIPIFKEWYKADGTPMSRKEILEKRGKELCEYCKTKNVIKQTEKKIARKILTIITQKRDECYIGKSIPHNVINKEYHHGGRSALNDVEKEIREKFDLRKKKKKRKRLQ